MANAVQEYRGISTLHQSTVPSRLSSMRNPGSERAPPRVDAPHAFPLLGSTMARPGIQRSVSDFAGGLDITGQYISMRRPSSTEPEHIAMRPAPLFADNLSAVKGTTDLVMAMGPDGTRGNRNFNAGGYSGAFMDPTDGSVQASLEQRRSVCQSPSWEAYALRKQEKKGAKKEREQSLKESKAKPNRLSKLPQPSSTPRSRQPRQHEQDTAPTFQRQSRERTNSMRTQPGTSYDIPPPRPARSRSNSINSLFRPNFDVKRTSIELSRNDNFIGGIKLEQQRFADEELATDENARRSQEQELGIHPALRTEKSQHRTETKIPAAPSAMRSRYPPNSMHTSPYAKTQALVSPVSSQVPEQSTINKWRTRIGLKPRQDSGKTGFTSRRGSSQTISGPLNLQTARVSSPDLRIPGGYPLDISRQSTQGFESALDLPGFGMRPQQSTSPPPPQPPRKSSKRMSITSLDFPGFKSNTNTRLEEADKNPNAYSNVKARLEPGNKNPNAYANVKARAPPRRLSIGIPSPIPEGSNGQKLSLKTDSRFSPESIHATTNMSALPRPQSSSRSVNGVAGTSPRLSNSLYRPATRSSVGSLSDEYRSGGSATTNVTTPEILSERGSFSTSPKTGTAHDKTQAVAQPSEIPPKYSPAQQSAFDSDSEYSQDADPKSRARFLESSSRPTNSDRGTQAELCATSEVPRPKDPAPKSAERKHVKVNPSPYALQYDPQSSIVAPGAATYLEEARKTAPTAPVPRSKSKNHGNAPSPVSTASPTSSTFSSIGAPSPLTPGSTSTFDHRSPRSPGRASSLKASAPSTQPTKKGTDLVAKMFVECCGCRYYHDMPSKLYEAMSHPETALGGPQEFAHSSVVSMTVRCPWCQHDMSTRCCAGLAALVYVKERLH